MEAAGATTVNTVMAHKRTTRKRDMGWTFSSAEGLTLKEHFIAAKCASQTSRVLSVANRSPA